MKIIQLTFRILIVLVVGFIGIFNGPGISGSEVSAASEPTVTATVSVGSGPQGIAVNGSTNRIYVADYSADSVSVINGDNNTVAASVSVGTQPDGIAVNAGTNRIYVANFVTNTISVINGDNNSVVASVDVGNGPSAVAVNAVTNLIYVANYYSGTASVINGDNNTVVATVSVENTSRGIAVNEITNRIYVVNGTSGSVSVIDGTNNSVAATVSAGTSPWGVAVNSGTNRVYVTNYGGNNVSVIDGDSNVVVDTVNVGSQPNGIAVNAATNLIYVANGASNNVSVIDGDSNSVVATVSVESDPFAVAVNARTNRIYVANNMSDTVSVIRYPLTITTDNLPTGIVDKAFSKTLEATGGCETGYEWSITSGELPAWANLDNVTGIISGTPDEIGASIFTVQVTDEVDNIAVKEFSLTVVYMDITNTLPPAEVKAPYPPQTLVAEGGTPPYKFAKVGKWPAGLTISKSGIISGKPSVKITEPTEYTLTVKITDSTTTPKTSSLAIYLSDALIPETEENNNVDASQPDAKNNLTATRTFKITIYPALDITLSGSTKSLSALPSADAKSAYLCELAASGGKAPYAWSKGADFPQWLDLDASTGVLSGTPTVDNITKGSTKVKVILTDNLGYTFTKSTSIKVNKALTITTASLPSGDMEVKYKKVTLKATGGKTPYTWSLISGELPENLVLDEKKGTLSGTPDNNSSGTYPLTFQVFDGIAKDNKTLSITINPTLAIDNLTNGTVGVAYSQVLSQITTGGSGGYKFSITSKELKKLPPGLKFTSKTGIISGTPTTAGTYTFDIKVTDSLKATLTRTVTVIIN